MTHVGTFSHQVVLDDREDGQEREGGRLGCVCLEGGGGGGGINRKLFPQLFASECRSCEGRCAAPTAAICSDLD